MYHHMLKLEIPENELDILMNDEFETRSSNDNNVVEGDSGDDEVPNERPKKKPYHRHSQHQTEEMEAVFKEDQHPGDKERKELGQRLGLDPMQIKFWFQNKRTQMKAKQERIESAQLKEENVKIKAEIMKCKAALRNTVCLHCGGPPGIGETSSDERQQLTIQNTRLREKIDRVSGITVEYVGKPMLCYPHMSPISSSRSLGSRGLDGEIYGAAETDLFRSVSIPTDADKPVIVELAVAAMEELVRLSYAREPMWILSGEDNFFVTLNEDEYLKTFPKGIGPKPLNFRSEASRESAIVIMNPLNLVEMFMDVNKWSSVFAGIVSRAVTVDVLSTGVQDNYNGALQLMTAEVQLPSPNIPTRQMYFLRYCKQHPDGSWAVVDVSLDNFLPSSIWSRCRRRPSGCLIQELPNGYSKVTWVEHVEVDDTDVYNNYVSLLTFGLAFGAQRWVATLDRQCERLTCAMSNSVSDVFVRTFVEGKKSMLKLSDRMVKSFCAGVGASTAHTWTTLSGRGSDAVWVMTRKSVDDPGRPSGVVLSAATSVWLPVPPKHIFDLLRDKNSRTEWDILSNGGVQEMTNIPYGRGPGNCVSILRVNSANSSQSKMLLLQESFTDSIGYYVIYAPVNISALHAVLHGGIPDYVALLPSGFAILDDGINSHEEGREISEMIGVTGGSLLTVSFQILVASVPTAKLSLGSVATVNGLIQRTIERISNALGCNIA